MKILRGFLEYTAILRLEGPAVKKLRQKATMSENGEKLHENML